MIRWLGLGHSISKVRSEKIKGRMSRVRYCRTGVGQGRKG